MTVDVGQQAPDFTLKDQAGNDVTLSAFRDKRNVVLVFYPFTFTGVCEGELCSLRDDLSDFEDRERAGPRDLVRLAVRATAVGEGAGVHLPRPQRLLAARCSGARVRRLQRAARMREPCDVRDRPARHRDRSLRRPEPRHRPRHVVLPRRPRQTRLTLRPWRPRPVRSGSRHRAPSRCDRGSRDRVRPSTAGA